MKWYYKILLVILFYALMILFIEFWLPGVLFLIVGPAWLAKILK